MLILLLAGERNSNLLHRSNTHSNFLLLSISQGRLAVSFRAHLFAMRLGITSFSLKLELCAMKCEMGEDRMMEQHTLQSRAELLKVRTLCETVP